ncbi:MAG: hypothetical protein ACI8WB_004411 [Phenylobacterium sp.]|jgi:hypothetical protein
MNKAIDDEIKVADFNQVRPLCLCLIEENGKLTGFVARVVPGSTRAGQ